MRVNQVTGHRTELRAKDLVGKGGMRTGTGKEDEGVEPNHDELGNGVVKGHGAIVIT